MAAEVSGRLEVRHERGTVGQLARNAEGRFAFAYDADWSAFAISLSLPLAVREVDGGAAHAFFANLLPEGAARELVCRQLGISIDNDFALLGAIGGECAGALSVVEPGAPRPDPEAYRYERLGDERLQALLGGDLAPLLVTEDETRLSLAGAQHKLPVAILDGEVQLSHGQAPTTHILKLPSQHYKHMPVNEAYVLGLAAQVGLDVVRAELFTRLEPPGLMVERYDRVAAVDEHWPARRIHQEDLCQALGRLPGNKYEREGGPSLLQAVQVVQRHSSNPLVDVRRLIEWQAFNLIAGNSDGHGKNLAFVHDEGEVRLAPFYDLVSTRHYRGIARSMAMRVADRDDPDQIGGAQWQAFAAEAGLGRRVVEGLVQGVVQRCLAVIDEWTETFRARYGEQSILQELPSSIASRAKRHERRLG
ncbi:MAG: type II toxin-antitoxin system HipA family toxin [Kofleriaceae bacterium]